MPFTKLRYPNQFTLAMDSYRYDPDLFHWYSIDPASHKGVAFVHSGRSTVLLGDFHTEPWSYANGLANWKNPGDYTWFSISHNAKKP